MTHRPPAWLARLVRDYPRHVVVVFVMLTIAAIAIAAGGLSIDTSVEALWVVDDPDREWTRRYKEDYANDEVIVAAFDLGRRFEVEDLAKLSALSEAVEELAGVERVTSLSNISDVRGSGGAIDASELVDLDVLVADPAAFSALVERVRGHRIYHGNVVSEGLDVLAMVIVLEPPNVGKRNVEAAQRAISSLLAEEVPPWRYHLTGYSLVEAESNHRMKQDLVTLSPPTAGVVLLLIFLFARSFFAIGLVVALVVWAEALTHAFYALTGTPINIVTSSVPSLVITVSATYGIYFIGMLQKCADAREPATAVLGLMVRPALVSGASTSVGFLSLYFIDIGAVRALGFGLAVGIFGAVTATLLLLPALIKLRGWQPKPLRYGWLEAFAVVGVRLARRPWLVLCVLVVLIVATVPGLSRLYVDTDPLDYLPEDSSVNIANDFLQERLSGTGVLVITLQGEGPNAAIEPEVTRFAADLLAFLKTTADTGKILSLLDYFYLIDAALRPEASPREAPPTMELAAQYLLTYEMGGDIDDLRPYLSWDRSAQALQLRTSETSSRSTAALVTRIKDFAAQHAPAGIEVRVLGSKVLFAKSAETISSGLIVGFAGAIGVVLLVFLLMLRSLSLALVSIVPNVLPVLFCGAAFGMLEIPISVGTSVVGLIAIGLAVDDTAHVVAHIDRKRGLLGTYRLVGPPIIVTTLALGLGFFIIMASQFQVVAIFGIATSLTLFTALFADVLVLPSLLRLLGYRLQDDAEPADGVDRS